MKLFIIFFACVALAYGSFQELITPCRRSDPKIENCIRSNIEVARKWVKEPFVIDRLDVSTSTGAAVDVEASLKNIETRRWTNFRIENLEVDVRDKNRYTANIAVVLPHLDLSTDYDMTGKLFGLKFRSYGKFKGLFNNISVRSSYVASPVLINGEEYLQLQSATKEITIAGGHLNIKPADYSFMGREIASYASSDPSGAIRLITPAINENSGRMAKEYLNKVLAKIPLKSLLVD